MKALRVTCVAGMVNIDSDDIAFGYIPGLCTGVRAGTSLQVNAHIPRRKAGVMCLAIAEAVAAFNASDNQDKDADTREACDVAAGDVGGG